MVKRYIKVKKTHAPAIAKLNKLLAARNKRKMAPRKSKVSTFLNAVEKKQTQTFINAGFDVGAAAGQANAVNCTPSITQGVGESQRIGNKCVITGATLDFQISSQSSAVNAIKYRYYLVTQPDSSIVQASGLVITKLLDPNVFSATSAIDWHSQRRTEFMKEFKVIAQGGGTLAPDSITGQIAISQKRRYLRLNLPHRYLADGSTDTILNQMYFIVVTDSGDHTLFTGAVVKMSMRYWYVDN